MGDRRAVRRRWWLLALAVVPVVVVVVIAWPQSTDFLPGPRPEQFHAALDPALLPRYPQALGVAHNAGNNLGTLAVALDHHADVIEVDVISVRGRLVAGRDQPLPWLTNHVFRGPALDQVWDAASAAEVLKLDLKQSDQAYLDALVDFLGPRQGARQVMIATRDPESLRYLRPLLPEVKLLQTLAFPDAVDRLRADPELLGLIDGVTVFHGLATPALVRWAHDHDLIVLAWTVNDTERLNTVISAGVDGVTTANLAILELLGQEQVK